MKKITLTLLTLFSLTLLSGCKSDVEYAKMYEDDVKINLVNMFGVRYDDIEIEIIKGARRFFAADNDPILYEAKINGELYNVVLDGNERMSVRKVDEK